MLTPEGESVVLLPEPVQFPSRVDRHKREETGTVRHLEADDLQDHADCIGSVCHPLCELLHAGGYRYQLFVYPPQCCLIREHRRSEASQQQADVVLLVALVTFDTQLSCFSAAKQVLEFEPLGTRPPIFQPRGAWNGEVVAKTRP